MEQIPGVIARHFNYSSKKCQILFVNNNEWINNFQFLSKQMRLLRGHKLISQDVKLTEENTTEINGAIHQRYIMSTKK